MSMPSELPFTSNIADLICFSKPDEMESKTLAPQLMRSLYNVTLVY